MSEDPDGNRYWHSEEQNEANKLAMEGKIWGESKCEMCGHDWVAIVDKGFIKGLECPNCKQPAGAIKQKQEPLDP